MLREMEMPPQGAFAEKQSFRRQNSMFKKLHVDVPPHVIMEVAALYPRTRVPLFLEEYGTEEFKDAFERAFQDALREMESDKTPGAFWNQISKNNGDLIADHYDEVFTQVTHLFEQCLLEDFSQLDSHEMFKRTGVCYKVFVKGEPHTVAKLDEGRQRLVFASPIHMTILERMIFGPQNQADIDNWKTCPSKPGLTMNAEGAEALRENVLAFEAPLVSTDQKGWDWHVQEWTMLADVEVRRELLDGSPAGRQRWHRVARNMNTLITLKTVMFSDGHVICQEDDHGGIWPSGSYRTSGTNSRMRVLVRRMACGDCKIITMGDDGVEADIGFLQEQYLEIGYVLKEPVPVTADLFEFCSKWFEGSGKVYPVEDSVRKMMVNLVRNPTDEARYSILMELKDYASLPYLKATGVFGTEE